MRSGKGIDTPRSLLEGRIWIITAKRDQRLNRSKLPYLETSPTPPSLMRKRPSKKPRTIYLQCLAQHLSSNAEHSIPIISRDHETGCPEIPVPNLRRGTGQRIDQTLRGSQSAMHLSPMTRLEFAAAAANPTAYTFYPPIGEQECIVPTVPEGGHVVLQGQAQERSVIGLPEALRCPLQ